MRLQTGSSITSSNMAFSTLPGSPTLTNPDMILPYGEHNETSEDSHRSPSPGQDWEPATMQFSIGPPSHTMQLTPETPIIYGNGTMLSDIGEVTEAESTVGRKLPGPAERRMLKKQAVAQAVMWSSPTLRSPASTDTNCSSMIRRGNVMSHTRTISEDSASTIRSEGQVAEMFKDFNDSVSVDDSCFQGDDEESVADSYNMEMVDAETERLAKKQNSDEKDENSSVALSKRAEQILLNAKMRLNNMEGNLFRARGTLGSASINGNSPLSRSSPSPLNSDQTPVDTPMASPGHSRVYSENAIPKASKGIRFPVRSTSAAARYRGRSIEDLGGDYNQEDRQNSGSVTPKHPPSQALPLEPLSENEVPSFKMNKASVASTIDDGYMSSGSGRLSRQTSLTQMRDLREQMTDLKGRLSVLRDRTQDDKIRRQSLQSLRTPSPFTAAEQWYTADTNYTVPELSADAGVGLPSQAEEEKDFTFEDKLSAIGDCVVDYPDHVESDIGSVYEDVIEDNSGKEPVSDSDALPEIYDTASEDAEGAYLDDASDYTEEMVNRAELDDYDSDSSYYHDTVATQVSHEDREDAFDYEHFFLHSAMGTISQRRRDSFSSDGSAETTVPDRPLRNRPSPHHLRSESATSVSTVETFQTATEGRKSDSDEDCQDFAVQSISSSRPTTPVMTKRSTFGSPAVDSPRKDESRRTSVIHDPRVRNVNAPHRPSVSSTNSFGSAGTNRSFPLVNKPKSQLSMHQNGSSDALNGQERIQPSPVDLLSKDDRLLVENLVASLGKCVLELQEAGETSYESHVWRRRLDAARRTLDGQKHYQHHII
ncbi:hypothetical protein BJ878DRAFT_106369 [Calycina marina]|uniref:Uncharacterized protein n=1 Tax=Calycina marina TaxID=1763456 RepID=A0A9P7Z9D4_9HELO|nr:hypothetical protein BJ878DRAFT_106369 [Calycina marina]